MLSEDEYIAGRHHFWTHFYCGLVFGAVLGTWVGWRYFEGGWRLAAVAVVALVVAAACGLWGDKAWRVMLRWLGSGRRW